MTTKTNFGAGKKPNYISDTELITTFLQEFKDPEGNQKYKILLEKISKREQILFPIELDDIQSYERQTTLCTKIEENTLRYVSIFSDVIDKIIPQRQIVDTERDWDIRDIMIEQRLQQQKNRELTIQEKDPLLFEEEITFTLPKAITRRYEIQFLPRSQSNIIPLRNIKAKHIGKMVLVKGIISRVSDVKSELQVATYLCDKCGSEIFQEINSKTFLPLFKCPSEQCKVKGTGNLNQQTRGSKFRKLQEIVIQEMSDEIPQGNIPRYLTIYARGELTRLCSPGDQITVNGIFLPIPVDGMRAIKQGPVANVYIEALNIQRNKKRYEEYSIDDSVLEITSLKNCFSIFANSISPEIYGHEDVKKALLLMLIGGVNKQIGEDGVKIRGDINICLMGDPGVAKSQLLRSVAQLSPRGIYTSGKGSSGVGLTAAVVKDPLTGDFVLEGGALVLADNGICCIDEFDKMDERDRTVLHEVMAQQSISIAKAGITTTLNARTSVLAAANPFYGRYNPKRSPSENINLPVALLSRFDLLFLLLDKPNEELDKALAKHITHVHQFFKAPETKRFATAQQLRSFISQAKRFNPVIGKDLTDYIAEAYTELRTEERETTPRTLISILRLSQSLAKARFSSEVKKGDVEEAIRLMKMSKISLEDTTSKRYDPISDIYEIIRSKANETKNSEVKINDIQPIVLSKGFKLSDLNTCLKEYEDINIWMLNEDKTVLRFLKNFNK